MAERDQDITGQQPGPPDDPNMMVPVGIVSHRTGGALVELRWGKERGQLDPHETANFVQQLMREAWWADSDAALVSFVREVLNMGQAAAAVFMADFRRHRLARLDAAAFEQVKAQRSAYEQWAREELERRAKQGGEGTNEEGPPP
jgi:hypothetical protein